MKKYLISSILIATAPFVVFADTGSESYPSSLYVAVTVVNNNPLSNQPITVSSDEGGGSSAIQFTTVEDESDKLMNYADNAILKYQVTKTRSGYSNFNFGFIVSNGKDNCNYVVMGPPDKFSIDYVSTRAEPSSADFCKHLWRTTVVGGNTYSTTINYNANTTGTR